VLLSALAAEATLLALASVLALAANVRVGSSAAYAIVALVALAMGVRNAIVRKLAVPDMTTTVLTMTLTGLVADHPVPARWPAGGERDWRTPARRIGVVLAMLVGALLGGLLQKHSVAAALIAASAVALACALVYRLSASARIRE
jgi:uncharacterized membrane protein YoaK (UPF0700 family)